MPLPAAAQHFSVGMKAGAATVEPLSTSGIFASQPHHLVWGPVVEVGLPYHSGIEVSALHRQIEYGWQAMVSTDPSTVRNEQVKTDAHSWEVPFVLKKYLHVVSGADAFAELGFAIRHTTSTTNDHGVIQQIQFVPPPFPFPPIVITSQPFSENIKTPELVRRTSDGLVIGGGMDIKIHFLRLQPELRYTRWSNATFNGLLPFAVNSETSSLRSNRNTFDFLIGVLAFR